jgi:hypothetical protein
VGVCVVQMSHCVLCPAHRDRHGRTTEAFTLLMSIGIPLEKTKRPELHTEVGVGAPTPSLREAGGPSTEVASITDYARPTGIVMLALKTLVSNASMAQI